MIHLSGRESPEVTFAQTHSRFAEDLEITNSENPEMVNVANKILQHTHVQAFRKTLLVDYNDFADNPKKLFLDFLQIVKENHEFPRIKYKDSPGIDAGGFTRDFVTRLFEALSIAPEKFGSFVERNINGLELKLQKSNLLEPQMLQDQRDFCIAIGYFFAFALKNYQFIRIGQQFNKSLFCMLHALSENDLDVILEKNQHPSKQMGDFDKIFTKLLKIYYKTRPTYLFAPLKPNEEAINEFVDEGKIPVYFMDMWGTDTLTDSENIKEVVKQLQVYEAIDAVFFLVSGMCGVEGLKASWDQIKGESPAELQQNIEGPIKKESSYSSRG
ncbi:MAG: hypothetical protein Q8L98_02305 [Chlamydiales bacterium]|nr:hypothetical protein [Chlamydiales bacterium]